MTLLLLQGETGPPCATFKRIRVMKRLMLLVALLVVSAMSYGRLAGGAEAKRAFEAMMPMKKIDVATIEKARRG